MFYVIECKSSTAHALHPTINLWRDLGEGPEEYRGDGEWLPDWGLGDYDSDVLDAIRIKRFESLSEALKHCPIEITQDLVCGSDN